MFQTKTSENELTRTEVSNLPDKWFKVMIIKILNKPKKIARTE